MPIKRGGGGELSKDSAFGLESWISSPRCVDRPQVLSSLRGLKSHDSSSKILESKSVNKKQAQAQKSHREQLSLESTFSQSRDSKSNAHFLSLRDTAQAVARQSTPQAKVDSSLNAISPSSRASETSVAIHKGAQVDSRSDYLASAEFVDCHADKSARNDKNATSEKVDSSTATILKQSAKDSSPKAESTNTTHLPFDDESFEVVTMLAVLEHLHHPHAMLQEIARVLKPSGALVLTVPSLCWSF